jgi:disulfide bond formation protein DsbB
MLLRMLDDAPRATLAAVSAGCVLLLGFGLYLQHGLGLEPCPMCIVQRYALIVVAIVAGLTAIMRSRGAHLVGAGLTLAAALFGAFVAARQTWLQWYPPEIATCGRDFYGMIETFPLKRAVPMIFAGGGDCSIVDWTFLGGSIANWSFVCFALIAVVMVVFIARRLSKR